MALDLADVALAAKVFQHDLPSSNTRPESASIDKEVLYSEKPQLESRGLSSRLSWSGVGLCGDVRAKTPLYILRGLQKGKPQ
jgi:hypothetical protein